VIEIQRKKKQGRRRKRKDTLGGFSSCIKNRFLAWWGGRNKGNRHLRHPARKKLKGYQDAAQGKPREISAISSSSKSYSNWRGEGLQKKGGKNFWRAARVSRKGQRHRVFKKRTRESTKILS